MLPLIKRVACAAILLSSVNLAVSPAYAEQLLTLETAVNTALEQSPVLASARANAMAAHAGRSQASALPNPELAFDADNIYGDGPYDGTSNAELSVSLAQKVELPGKRGGRIGVAEAEQNRSYLLRDATRLDLIRDVVVAYAEVVNAGETVSLLEEELKLADEVSRSVSARVEAGKEPPIQSRKADVERSASQIALERARRDLAAKSEALRVLMGQPAGASTTLEAESLPPFIMPEPLEVYADRLARTPDAQALGVNVARAESALSFERANALPDPTFTLGIKKLREDNAQALLAGVSLPLPVFDLNRAGVARAGHELNAAQLEQNSGELSLNAQLSRIYGDFSSAYEEANTLEQSVLPNAEEAFSFARAGYEAGKFGYLDVLGAQRTLFETRRQFNDATLEYYRQKAAIDRLTARHATASAQAKQ